MRALVIDLNNFARYPTVAVGYVTAALRKAGHEVSVYSPLAHGVPGLEREPTETTLRDAGRRLSYLMASRASGPLGRVRSAVERGRRAWAERGYDAILEGFETFDLDSFDVVLISAYLMYREACVQIGLRCAKRGKPLLIGGSYFASEEVARAWLDVPGLTALIGGEVELELAALVETAVAGGDLSTTRGVWLPSGVGSARPPLRELDAVPFPDYRDFPWHAYPNRIVPMITGRGCGWGVCQFCSDVTSTAGRTYRSRSPRNVLDEIEMQSKRHDTHLFAFVDLKLNSSPEVWEALVSQIRSRCAEARWIGAVHVGREQPNGLDRATLVAARRAGMVRMTTGLESGSQRVLDRMRKGTDLAVTSRFLTDAAHAGISVRVTMIHGYPGETAEDVVESAVFLERHRQSIDRVLLNRFQIMIGPTFLRHYDADATRFPGIKSVKRLPQLAIANHEYEPAQTWQYAKAVQRLLSAVHAINRKPLLGAALQFEGVM